MSAAVKREQQREQRRNLILDAAERTFYAKGLELATMDEVAAQAQLAKGTLYLYFRNKEDLLLGVALRRQRAVLQRYAVAAADASNGLDELRRLLLAYAEHMISPPEHFRLMLNCWIAGPSIEPDLPSWTELRRNVTRAINIMCNAIERGRRDESIRPGPDAQRVVVQLWSAVNGALLLRVQLGTAPADSPVRDFAPTLDEAVDAYLEAVRADRSTPHETTLGRETQP